MTFPYRLTFLSDQGEEVLKVDINAQDDWEAHGIGHRLLPEGASDFNLEELEAIAPYAITPIGSLSAMRGHTEAPGASEV
jgi:hypothetical protein